MQRQGFIPYGPSRAATESMSAIMAADLREDHIDVNLLLPGGATDTGMIPDDQRGAIPLLSPAIMAEPIVFLASAAADGISGERIIAKEFSAWLEERRLDDPDPGH
jgi:gluconate 5-dehydrogenase